MELTRIGGPTILVELDGWRVLLDPTFDPPGRRYSFALGTSSVKTLGPFVDAEALGPIDLVLLSHDHHADNLDDAGRALLPSARHVVTTPSGAKRLALPNTQGLKPGATIRLEAEGRPPIDVTATPCRHGPPFTRPIVGEAIGFALRRPGESKVALWVVGDTVLSRPVRQVARDLDVDVAIVNVGGVRFPLTGALRYTMTGADAVTLVADLEPRVVVPAHYDGWSHFHDGENGIRTAVERAPAAVHDRFTWLPDGVPTSV